jgi:2,3-bisphosphoglycerate-independent phosphoglycerate mutase
MKRVALLLDAAADLPYPELQDETPLQHARLPFSRNLAAEGQNGSLRRQRREADASRALLAEICGVGEIPARDLRWGPVAAASLNLPLRSNKMYLLGGFLSIDERNQQNQVRPSSMEEQEHLLKDLCEVLSREDGVSVELHTLAFGRFVMELEGEGPDWPLIQVQYEHNRFMKRLPKRLVKLLSAAEKLLEDHPVNQIRVDLGEPPIRSLWCWSGGKSVQETENIPFKQALVSPDPLAQGLSTLFQREYLRMEDPYSLDRPDAAFDVFEMMRLLENHDEIVMWIPAPFSSQRFEGSAEKVRRLDAVDYYVTGPVKAILDEIQPSRLLLMAAGVRHRGRPERGVAPFVLWGDGIPADDCRAWTEVDSTQGSLGTPKVKKLLEIFRKET